MIWVYTERWRLLTNQISIECFLNKRDGDDDGVSTGVLRIQHVR